MRSVINASVKRAVQSSRWLRKSRVAFVCFPHPLYVTLNNT